VLLFIIFELFLLLFQLLRLMLMLFNRLWIQRQYLYGWNAF